MKEAQPQRILIVDDEPMVCASVRMMLEVHGFKPECAGSGAEALSRLENERFDLMITDYSMPRIKGDQLSLLTKQRWPQMRVLMLTAFAAALDDKCFSNADAVLSKPCSARELNDVVVSIFEAGAVQDQAAADELARLRASKDFPQAGSSAEVSRDLGK